MKRKLNLSCYGYGYGYGYGDEKQEDRLSTLSDDVLLCILSLVETRLVIQSSILSKRWVNLWTLLPALNFDSSPFVHDGKYILDDLSYKSSFDIFIDNVFARRNLSVKIDDLNIKVNNPATWVFNHDVNGVLNMSIDTSKNISLRYFPIQFSFSIDTLMSLTLKGMMDFGKLPTFVGLVTLRLERIRIVESEPFSSFPNLEKLFLVNCKLHYDLNVLEVVGYRLSRLTISSCTFNQIPYERLVLSTPKLVLFELEGLIPMLFEAFDLPSLDTVYIDCVSSDDDQDDKRSMLYLIDILGSLENAKCVHLSPTTIELLSLDDIMLIDECPFTNLKVLNLIPLPNKPLNDLASSVVAYLLGDCPRAIVKSLPR